MTVIEFFSEDGIENIVSMLLCRPQKVVFVGDSLKEMERAAVGYRKIAENRGISVEISCRSVGKNNLSLITEVLTRIVTEEDVCTFDLEGGEELYLVAVGILFERYPQKVQLHRFNVQSGRFYDCDADGKPVCNEEAVVTVDENIRAYGGRVLYEEDGEETTWRWDFNPEFVRDIEIMWKICAENPRSWNRQMNTLEGYARFVDDGLEVQLNHGETEEILTANGYEMLCSMRLLLLLERQGILQNLTSDNGQTRFHYKNAQIKKCLTKAGQELELYVMLQVMQATDREDRRVFTDALTGVVIDWNDRTEEEDIKNEIDVLAMKGLVPVFISCKNGYMEAEELYKLSTVAKRFGGKFARRVLVAPQLSKMGKKGAYIRARASEMGIRVIEDLAPGCPGKVKRIFRSL